MAEFKEVMRQAKRLCEAQDGENPCDECPITDYCMGKLYVIGKYAVPIEEYVTKWAKEHPEPQYPTWEEWLKATFNTTNAFGFHPCTFVNGRMCDISECSGKTCKVCREQPIPAGIAEKLGIRPKGEQE